MRAASQEINAQSVFMTSPPGITELYENHSTAVFRAALRVTGNPADAEDVLQTVFLRFLSQGDRLDPSRVPRAYFRRAAVNAAVDLLRRRITRGESPFDEALPHGAVESPALLKERLRRAIATLEESDAVLFLLRYVEGLSNGELAEMFGQEKNHISVRLYRIRQTLQAEMER